MSMHMHNIDKSKSGKFEFLTHDIM